MVKAKLLKAGRSDLARLFDTPKRSITWKELREIITSVTLAAVTEKAKKRLLSDFLDAVFKEVETETQARGESLNPSCAVTEGIVSLLFLKLSEAVQKAEGKTSEPPSSSSPTTKPRHTDHIEVLGSHLYHNLRSAYAAKSFSVPEGERWPAADLSGARRRLRALAQLRPDPKKIEPYLSSDELAAWQEKIGQYVLSMDDLTADVLDIISAVWLRQAEHPEAMVTVTADDFLRYRGLQPRKGGSGRRGGYRKELRQEIARHIAILSSTWITVFEMDVVQENEKGRRQRTKWRGESRVVVVTSRFGQERLDGTMDVHAWRVRPGDVFAKFLFGPGRQTALLSQRALEYDPFRQKWEKRLTRYFSWQWRIRQGGGKYLEPISVGKLLEGINKTIDAKNPVRTKERLEKALDTLVKDGVIAGWQYEAAREEIVGQRGWWEDWLTWKVIIEPPQVVVDHYAKIPQAPRKVLPSAATELGQWLREERKARGLTLLQAAEEIGISPSRLSEIERAKKPTVSENVKRKIQKWLDTYS